MCCVTGDTRIQTNTYSPKIKDVVGKKVKIWNGDKWSEVTPFLASKNKDIYRVTLSDGSYLDCTDNHKWSIQKKGKKIFKQYETLDLRPGDKVQSFSLHNDSCKVEKNAFTLGVFAGDGYLDNNIPMIALCGDKRKLKDYGLVGKQYKEQILEGYKDPLIRTNIKGIFDLNLCKELNNKDLGLPNYLFSLDKKSILEFVAGYIEADGTLHKNLNSHNYKIFGSESKMRDLQLLLRKANINHTTVRLMFKKGTKTNKGVRNRDLYVLTIPSYECNIIPTKIKKAYKFTDGTKTNNAFPFGKKISYKRTQKITKIEKLEEKQDTYCFTEPINHMGVFGNVLTYQCLVETFPTKHETLEDYLRTLKFAYLYAKTVTLTQTHWPETNRIMMRNRRIGTSVSGITQFIGERGLNELKTWLNKGYNIIQNYDCIYSDWFAVPKSIKTTSVKPSGTVSLLAGTTPGVHYPESSTYIRRIRVAKNSDLIEPLRKANYTIEEDKNDISSYVVEFPIQISNTKTIDDISIWEQLELAAFLQEHWADNQVSCTVTFKDFEKDQIEPALNYFQYKLKGVSFLPKLETTTYPQMPYEQITEEQYKEKIKNIKKVKFKQIQEDAIPELYCDSESCTIK